MKEKEMGVEICREILLSFFFSCQLNYIKYQIEYMMTYISRRNTLKSPETESIGGKLQPKQGSIQADRNITWDLTKTKVDFYN